MGKLLNAVVKFPASKILNTKYGEKVNAIFECNGEEIAIWADANSQKAEMLKNLTKGEQRLILDDNGKYKLLEDEETTKTNSNSNNKTNKNYEPLTDDKKREIGAYIKDMASLYSFCRETSIKTLSDRFDEQELTPDDIRSMTATLFIATQKHFSI